MNALRTALTGRDNASIDIGRVLWGVVTMALCGLEGHAVMWMHQAFDPMSFAGAASALLTAGGAGLALKSHTEPECK